MEVTVFGAGGCGVNLVTRLVNKTLKDDIKNKISLVGIDTCDANFKNLPIEITKMQLSDDGAGGVRTKHLDVSLELTSKWQTLSMF